MPFVEIIVHMAADDWYLLFFAPDKHDEHLQLMQMKKKKKKNLKKCLQKVMSPTICLSLLIAKVEREHNSHKIILFFFLINQVIYSSGQINLLSLKVLAQIVFKKSF